jgi:uncharacterized protein YecE (DUF72 family)
MAFHIGTAGWALRKPAAAEFAGDGSHLERYASRMNAVEINSSFYRPHRRSTYERWAASTPDGFKFSVKVPKPITHEKRLVDCDAELESFVNEATGLGDKLGPLLLQLPPSLVWSEQVARDFFAALRAAHRGVVVCEPRHASWFDAEPTRQLEDFAIGRVAADPSIVASAAIPGGDLATSYFRWHGSPRVYYSDYDAQALNALASQLMGAASVSLEVWCIFDNTAGNAAIHNALELSQLVASE